MLIGFGGTRRSYGFVVAVLAAPLAWAGSPTVSSTFDTDLEGWEPVGFVIDDSIGAILGGTVLTPQINVGDMVHDAGGGAFDGNPGGFARFTDFVTDPASFASAPGAFLGDLTGYTGGTFSFDHRLFTEGTNTDGIGPYAIIFISGNPNDLAAYGAVFPGPAAADTGWVNVSVNLTDGGPGGLIPVSQIDLGAFDPEFAGDTAESLSGGLLTTSASFDDVMSNVTQVLVSFELVDNNGTQVSEAGGIDNVTLQVPEPSSVVLLGLAGVLLVRRRRH